MSLENAILELAKSMAQVAESNHVLAKAYAGSIETMAAEWVTEDLRDPVPRTGGGFVGDPVDSSGADKELEQAVEKVEAAAKKPSAKSSDAKASSEASAEAGAASSDPKPDASGAAEPEDTQAGAEPLSYEKDVKPVLIKLAGARGKQALTDLIASFGVLKADKLNAEQLVAAKAQAEALIAG